MTADRPLGNVLITGGASGLGAAVAAAVRDAGGRPLVLDLDVSAVEGPDAYACDVSDTRATEQLVTDLAARYGGLDAVVTAAGIDRPAPLDGIDGAAWERIVAVNLLGTAAVVRAALPALTATHGRAVIVASSLAIRALGHATAYSASKFGVKGFARSLAAETQGRIGVTTIFPAGMRTRFFEGRDEQYKPGPDAHLIDPREVADAIVFALRQKPGVEIRELVICPEDEPSWP
ncbi:SDR family oxidoreductase [Microbacterium trichothecenolyticum]|uniref:NAD(P)-dependent dehydrogenase (Short-subunit alcohol dehydrogenase family) n=1 Tax=Microbacterium trichothecenolyticum TaxID=69370 RepID=A0ABU0TSH7_MICTR|nr:SDR family oxidoreductase [Microbacterium trichothecenolyticum]MDQ1122615.1 NAD(P)-dependent dehydrogenase (short-subunit alcohol dehydrogenase family) [Microbacterium trichothecenolyticum]